MPKIFVDPRTIYRQISSFDDVKAIRHIYVCIMSQLTVYLPEAVLRKLRAGARRARKSVSAYVTELLERREKPAEWPDGFRELYGSCRGTLPEIDDTEPEAGPEL
jgi:hypothetical protein